MSRLVIREVRGPDELCAVQDVARLAWGFEDRQLPSTHDLHVAHHVGGLTAAAFDGQEMVGFVHGLPRTNWRGPCHHSHLLAVRPEWRGRDVSVRLKLFQRAWCLARGIRAMTWTYDPLMFVNARLNLVRLRARAVAFHPNFYGSLGGLYGDLPTDRFEVLWTLDAPEVEAAALRHPPEQSAGTSLPLATPAGTPSAPRVAVEVPAGGPELYRQNPAAARRERARLRRVATRLFAAGYEATGITDAGETAFYVFERPRRRGAAPARRGLQYLMR
jgi:chorismate synthase